MYAMMHSFVNVACITCQGSLPGQQDPGEKRASMRVERWSMPRTHREHGVGCGQPTPSRVSLQILTSTGIDSNCKPK